MSRLALLAPLFVLAELALHQPGPAYAALGPWHRRPEVRLRLVVENDVAAPSGPIRLGLEFVTEKGWHVYWKNPGDAGFPMQITSPTPVLGNLRLHYPAPHRFALPGDLQAFGYEGAVLYPVDADLTAPAGARSTNLALDVDYLVCEVECIPYREALRVEIPLAPGDGGTAGATPDPDATALLDAWRARVAKPAATIAGLTVTARRAATLPADSATAIFTVSSPQLEPATAEFFVESHPEVDFGPIVRRDEADRSATFSVPLRPRQRRPEGIGEIELAWTLTGLRDDVAAEGRSGIPRRDLGAVPATPQRSAPVTAIVLSALVGVGILGLILFRLRRAP